MSWANLLRARPRSQCGRFEALLSPHVQRLYASAYRYTGTREDAEDLVQDLLIKLYPRTRELERIEDLKPWLTRSLYNAFIDRVRKSQRTPQGDGTDADDLVSPQTPDAELDRTEQQRALEAAIATLSPDHRAVVVLHLMEGHSLVELEYLLGVQLGTLKSRLHRAKAHLRKALQPMEPETIVERVSGHDV